MNYTQIQQALNKLGADPRLKLTGVYDGATIIAVKAFQKNNNLTVDGLIGPLTSHTLAQKLNPNGIPVALAVVLDCTDWDTPSGGWSMPRNVAEFRFFRQPLFPGGGYGSVANCNQDLSCGHVQVPADPVVLAYVEQQCSIIRKNDPNSNYYALLIRGLTLGDDALSRLEYEQQILQKYNIECEIVSEGTFAHENQGANIALAYGKAIKGYKIILMGHSMGGDEIVPACQFLNRSYVLNA